MTSSTSPSASPRWAGKLKQGRYMCSHKTPLPPKNHHTANWKPAQSRMRTAKAVFAGQTACTSTLSRFRSKVCQPPSGRRTQPLPLACIFHFRNSLDASHSHILKSQVHRERSYLFKVLKTCTSVCAVSVSRTYVIFSRMRIQPQPLATPALHWAPAPGA